MLASLRLQCLDTARKPARSLHRQPRRVLHAPSVKRLLRPASSSRDSFSVQKANDSRDIAVALQTVAASVVAGGLLAGTGCGLDDALPHGVQHLSATLGWSYFTVWSLSFYPQVFENWRRKSVDGLSADYLVYSILGYAAYTVYTAALYWSPGVQAAYITAHAGSAPDVCLADFLFAAHATLMSAFTLYQCYLYSSNDRSSAGTDSSLPVNGSPAGPARVLATSRTCQVTALGVIGAIAAYASHIGSTCGIDDCDAWLPLLLLLGITKVMMTLIKYTPQALLNARRQSTKGWQINNVLLDLAGGLLSFAQIGVNAFARADVSVITGNPAKIGISAISIGFDILFILQHYVFYRPGSRLDSSNMDSNDAGEPVVTYQRPAEVSSGIRKLARRAVAVAVNATQGARPPR